MLQKWLLNPSIFSIPLLLSYFCFCLFVCFYVLLRYTLVPLLFSLLWLFSSSQVHLIHCCQSDYLKAQLRLNPTSKTSMVTHHLPRHCKPLYLALTPPSLHCWHSTMSTIRLSFTIHFVSFTWMAIFLNYIDFLNTL